MWVTKCTRVYGVKTTLSLIFLADNLSLRCSHKQQWSLIRAMPFDILARALAKTHKVDAKTPDSVGTMMAVISGLRTDVGVIGVDEDISDMPSEAVAAGCINIAH
jgi:alkaline phosphatase